MVDKEPTATEPGIGHYECIACAFDKAPEEFGKRNPETGASSLAAWIAVAAVAGGAVPVTYKARKRKNKQVKASQSRQKPALYFCTQKCPATF